MQLRDNRIRRPYPMNNLPVSWHTDSNLEAETVYINEYFAGGWLLRLAGLRKVGLAGKEDWRHSLIIRGLRML